MKNDRLLKALRREAVDRTPVWMMRQAGRYLPEYRATRQKAGSFLRLMRTPELAAEVTLQPLQRFPLDAAILFSDILTIPDAMGLGLEFVEGEGPRFARPLQGPQDIAKLGVPDPAAELRYVLDAVRAVKAGLGGSVPLIGFAGSPWTLACYMIEGGGSASFARIKQFALDEPQALDALLGKLADAVTAHLAAQAAAGADALMVFDTWGGVLAPGAYARCSLAPMARIVDGLCAKAPAAPVILFTKNGGQHLEAQAATGAAALGVDWTQGLRDARRRVGSRVALQGNLDPTTLLARPECIRAEVARVLDEFGDGPGHVFNLGHGILPQTPPEHAAAMIAAVHEQSLRYHRQREPA